MRLCSGASATAVAEPVDWWFATVMGVVEGLTEFLPVSSTGHLIVTSAIFGREDPAFEIAIQLGAITAILFLYWGRVWGACRSMFRRGPSGATDGETSEVNLLWLLFFAALPAAIVGLPFKSEIQTLLFNPTTVGVSLITGGLLLFWLEAFQKKRGLDEDHAKPAEAMTIKQATIIGLFQCLSLIPGTSRAGATIAGAMVLGFRRTSAAEFSFLVGLPVLYGAGLLEMVQDREQIFRDPAAVTEFCIALVASFVSAALVVKPFVRFLQRHTFVPFAWYRIVAGVVLLALVWRGWL